LADVEHSLITDEHRAVIGVPSQAHEVVIRDEDARRMRDLLGDKDPRWAEGTGIAPPYVMAALDPGPPGRGMPRILPGGILTQMEWQFHRPFRIGERLRIEHKVTDIRERLGGRYGYSVIIMMETAFVDTEGEAAASMLRTFTQFDPAAARGEDE